jgi:outer membrane protein
MGQQDFVDSFRDAPAQHTRSSGNLQLLRRLTLLLAVLCLSSLSSIAAGTDVPTNILSEPLSLADAVSIALKQSPAVLRAQKEVEATEGVVLQTRAVAIPKVRLTGFYTAAQESDVDIISSTNFTFGNNQNWETQIRVVQSLYAGGRINSALRASKLAREQSRLNFHTAVANTVLDVEVAYFDVLLGKQQVSVEEASVELSNRELSDTTKRYNAGTVPRFNVLRAEVELANAQPRLFRAQSNYRIAKNSLANQLGYNLPREALEDIPLNLTGKLDPEPYNIELPAAIDQAREKRTELASLRKAQALRHEEVISAKSGYKPALDAYGGYDTHNTMLSRDLTDNNYGWIAGVQLSWDLFDGYRTRGRLMQTRAQEEAAGIELDDTSRKIELEVRTAFSTFREARETLRSQEKVVEQGDEALRLARARSEAGTATQLDVLGAQTALTQARTTQVQAQRDYAVAKARLQRAIGELVPSPAN